MARRQAGPSRNIFVYRARLDARRGPNGGFVRCRAGPDVLPVVEGGARHDCMTHTKKFLAWDVYSDKKNIWVDTTVMLWIGPKNVKMKSICQIFYMKELKEILTWLQSSKEPTRYGPKKLKGKYHHMRFVHTKFSELINHTSVTWDVASGKVFANDTVWDDYFRREKVFKTFKKKGCKIYPLLSLVFSSSTTSKRRIEDEYLDVGSVGESAFDGGSRKGKRKPEGDIEGLPGTRREKKKDTTNTFVEEYSIGDCLAILEVTTNVSSKSYNKALSLFLDINWRKMFLMISENRRKD
uniref:Myb/SANT-like domain-containing protein n=1 Tax=Lactuca sativa TaxID=4236 RepID=A0A9R1UPY0_LACSA|nr:hypothetical protein LSAT_V11C800412780 [Lactuca sativa]